MTGGSMTIWPEEGLRLPGTVTPTALVLPEELSEEQWRGIGERLGQIGGAWQWWYGDWFRYGARRYGDSHALVLRDDDPVYQSKADAAWVARAFAEVSRRREILPWSFHREVAALEPAEADALLDQAEEHGWTRAELRQAVRLRRPSGHAQAHQRRLELFEREGLERDLSRIPEPFWDAVVQAEALSYLEDLARLAPDGAADVCVTSPPYWMKRAYSEDPRELGREPDPASYVARLVAIIEAVGAVLVPDGYLFLNLGDTYASQPGQYRGDPERIRGISDAAQFANGSASSGRILDVARKSLGGIPWRVLLTLTLERGWRCANVIAWSKPNHAPENVFDRLTQTWEPILLLTRSEHAYLRREAVDDAGDTWAIPAGRGGAAGGHLAPFPEALAERAIELACPPGGIVLDPFAGSGTTLDVARRLGRRFLGCDLLGAAGSEETRCVPPGR